MGKLSIAQVDALKSKGRIDDEQIATLQDEGLVGTRRRGNKRYLKNGMNGTKVTPTLYFAGFGKGKKYTPDMTEIKLGFNKLVKKFTTTDKENNKDA